MFYTKKAIYPEKKTFGSLIADSVKTILGIKSTYFVYDYIKEDNSKYYVGLFLANSEEQAIKKAEKYLADKYLGINIY